MTKLLDIQSMRIIEGLNAIRRTLAAKCKNDLQLIVQRAISRQGLMPKRLVQNALTEKH